MFGSFIKVIREKNAEAWGGQVEVEVKRGTLAGTPVLRAYDKDLNMHMAKDEKPYNVGQSKWTEKVDRKWWNSVKSPTCGSRK
jgi:hypothetical protein